MHCRRRRRAGRGTAITRRARRSTPAAVRWVTNSPAIRASRAMDRVMQPAVTARRTFQSRRRAILSTTGKPRRLSRDSAAW